MKRNHTGIIVALFLILIVFLGLVLYMIGFKSFNNMSYSKVTVTDSGIADAVEKVIDSVVLIDGYKDKKLISAGTGFIYKIENGNAYLLTNYHVINGTDSATITLSDQNIKAATIVGGDEFLDIAVLKVDKGNIKTYAHLGSSKNQRLGDTVFTIGTPVDNKYINTVTRGILSGKDRLISVSISGTNTGDYVMRVLQTDAAMNPGNSGGPLLNINGEVIGINSLKIADNEIEGMGFAIPIEDVIDNIKTLEKGEKIKRPLLGLGMINLSDTYLLRQEGINISSDINYGVVVGSVLEKSPADGVLQKGDVIIKMDDVKLTSLAYFRYQLYKHQVGDTVKITFIRDGKTITKDILLSQENKA